jgi:hypothetical protein
LEDIEGTNEQVPNGIFWADFIKTLRDRPRARLKIACDYLPLPAAYEEACVALRGIIRAARKQGTPYEADLRHLYRLTTERDLLLHVPYIQEFGEPGFNVAASIPREVVDRLDMPYADIGYSALNAPKTDAKWFAEVWGEPRQHISAHEYHHAVWEKALGLYRKRREREEERSRAEWRALMSASTPEQIATASSTMNRGTEELRLRFATWRWKVFGETTEGWEEEQA